MEIHVRPVAPEELPAYFEAMTTSFLERVDVAKVAEEVRPFWDLNRVWAALDDRRICGTFRSFATELTVPGGGRLQASAVAAVTVLPTHRRRGVLRRMAAADHAASRERGDAVALLYASEFPIYGNLGYGPACRTAAWTLNASATGFHKPAGGTATGSIELVAPDENTREAMKSVFEAWRARQAGEIMRRDIRWDYDLAIRPSIWGPTWKGFVVFHRDAAGNVDGYVRYRAEEKFENLQPAGVINVDDMHALTDEAYGALWRFLAEVDLVTTVKAERRSPSERLPWLLTNFRAAAMSEVGDGMWVRLLDVPGALAARTYEREGSVVLEVIDAEAPDGRLRVKLDASTDGASCVTTLEAPDLTLDVGALGAAYLGGTRLRDAARAKGADEHSAGALAKADALFRTAEEPWTSTFF